MYNFLRMQLNATQQNLRDPHCKLSEFYSIHTANSSSVVVASPTPGTKPPEMTCTTVDDFLASHTPSRTSLYRLLAVLDRACSLESLVPDMRLDERTSLYVNNNDSSLTQESRLAGTLTASQNTSVQYSNFQSLPCNFKKRKLCELTMEQRIEWERSKNREHQRRFRERRRNLLLQQSCDPARGESRS